MNFKKLLTILLLVTFMSATGCAKSNIMSGSAKSFTTEIQSMDIKENTNKSYEAEVIDFDLGDESYISSSARELPYKIRGTMAIPKGDGKFPIVLITHGSHENMDESKRFDSGFDYLVKSLAENGYIAVSMDMSKAYIWKYGDNDDNEKTIAMTNKQIEKLKLVNEGENQGYKVDLTNKIDFDKLSLMGHSRGGETVFDIANDQISKGQNIQSVLSLAPTAFFDREYGNYDISVLVPEYDGDVSTLDGFKIYEEMKSKNRDNLTSITLLEKANHNYFNKNILINDAKMNRTEDELSNQLSREDQEKFLSNFAVDFFNASISNNIENTMYDLNLPQVNEMYGYNVKVQTINNKVNNLIDVKNTENFLGEGATIENTQDSWFYADDKVTVDTVTFGDDAYKIRPLINIKWTSIDDKVKVLPKSTDFSNNNSLVFNVVIDSSNELNEKHVSQRFSIEIKDKSGNTSKIVLPENLSALAYTQGKIDSTKINGEDFKFWTSITPIGQLKLPLSEFKNINLKNVDSVSLIFDQTNSGSILIDSIELQ